MSFPAWCLCRANQHNAFSHSLVPFVNIDGYSSLRRTHITSEIFILDGNTPVLNKIVQMCEIGLQITDTTFATVFMLKSSKPVFLLNSHYMDIFSPGCVMSFAELGPTLVKNALNSLTIYCLLVMCLSPRNK